ncbi:variant erythrocyte surface antigen-1 family protein [Babesia caballi]|uniref:Variant erythrocyte surface antigen-1 family protein n=1 Tax=Babesia caballi TaxID=5871 RepID=A0AAV4LNL3_BABCB|nr:variant erythrocyte surface antigen-1 family protein [Babesia caballi]
MNNGCSNVTEPKTLKDALDIFGVLNVNSGGLKEHVFKEIEGRVKTKLNLTEEPKSYSVKGDFDKVVSSLETLRTSILGDSGKTKYGNYSYLQTSGEECRDICVTYILGILPELYATLIFLLYNLDDTYTKLGGEWAYEQCNSGTLGTLNDLLIDSGVGEDGYLRHLLLDLAVITEFSSCSVATWLTVVRALCENTNALKSQIGGHGGLEQAINTVLTSLKPLAPEENGEDDEALLTALFDGRAETYLKQLQPAAFEGYMTWVKDNLDELVTSLNNLKTDSAKWQQEGLRNATMSGPFGYGFSFTENWKSWEENPGDKIPKAIDKLTVDLKTLKNALEDHLAPALSAETSGSFGTGSAEPGSDGSCTSASSGTVSDVPVPKDLKEAIDWVLRVSGRGGRGCGEDGINGLAEAVEHVLKTVDSTYLGPIISKTNDIILKLSEGLKTFVGYNVNDEPDGSGIASNKYKSSYEDNAKWEPSWNSASDANSQKCAKVFLGYVPLIYYGVTYLYWRCAKTNGCNGNWEAMSFNGEFERTMFHGKPGALNDFMEAVGYADSKQLSSKSGDDVMSRLMGTFNELNISYFVNTANYDTFLEHVRQKGQTCVNSSPPKCPLYSLHSAAEAYWNCESAQASEIRVVIDAIKEAFEQISKTTNKLDDNLRMHINALHNTLMTFLNPGSSDPGSDGLPKPG